MIVKMVYHLLKLFVIISKKKQVFSVIRDLEPDSVHSKSVRFISTQKSLQRRTITKENLTDNCIVKPGN